MTFKTYELINDVVSDAIVETRRKTYYATQSDEEKDAVLALLSSFKNGVESIDLCDLKNALNIQARRLDAVCCGIAGDFYRAARIVEQALKS